MPSRPLFEHRHFVWLAKFAADYLNDEQRTKLRQLLNSTNPNFDAGRFMAAASGLPSGRDKP